MRRSPATTAPASSRREVLTAGLSAALLLLSPATPSLAAPPPTLIGREVWGAAPARPGLVPHTITAVTIHHTAVPARPGQDTAARLRSYQDNHQRVRGWPDIAYHLIIGPSGEVYAGRDRGFRGDSSTRYALDGQLLVCLDGDFEAHPLPVPQGEALTRLLAWAQAAHRVPAAAVQPHRARAATACPGRAVMEWLR